MEIRRPDFQQIGTLIESFQTLDRTFRDVFDDIDRREKKLIRTCRQILTDEAAQSLAAIPVEELKKSRAGIRTAALEQAGYHTLLSLRKASDEEILAVEGIGEKQLLAIRTILDEFVMRMTRGSGITLTADKEDRTSREIIRQTAAFRKMELIRRDAGDLGDELHGFLERTIPHVVIRSGVRWFFSRRQTKEETLEAVAALTALRDTPEYRRVKHFIEAHRAAAGMSDTACMSDFSENSAAYYALLEKLTGMGKAQAMRYSSIPAQLAAEIDAQELDLTAFQGNLRAYQEFGARYILHQNRVLLGDEMGLGKTVEAIAVMAHLYAKDPGSRFLVVCPASVLVNWCREIMKFSAVTPFLLHGPSLEERLDAWVQMCGAAVTNYESLEKIVNRIDGQLRLDLMVIDEAHYIKNPEAKRTRRIHALEDEADRILMMTGTPLENRVDEMCELIGFVRPDLTEEIRTLAGMRHAPQFREILAPVYLRRHRDDLLTELPPLTQKKQWCAMTEEDRLAYVLKVRERNFPGMRRLSFLQEDMQTSSKAQRLLELCREALDEGRKVVVYSYFRDTLGKVQALLADMCEGAITGSTPVTERQGIIDRFAKKRDACVLVCQVQSGGTGLNIQAASVVIFCEPQIKPSLTNQAIARVCRMGQIRNVLVYHLLCEDTVDEAVTELLEGKQAEFDLFAEESVLADAADHLADKEWITGVIEREQNRYLPAVIDSEEEKNA